MQISEDHYREVVTAKARRLVLYVTRDQWAPALSRHRFLLFEIINIQQSLGPQFYRRFSLFTTFEGQIPYRLNMAAGSCVKTFLKQESVKTWFCVTHKICLSFFSQTDSNIIRCVWLGI